jgi:hypothetical protein
MKGKELLDTYPKVAKIIKEYFTTKLLESLPMSTDVPEEFRNTMKERGVADEMLANIIDKNPAALFEIFDSLQVYVGIVVQQVPITGKVIFNYYICPKGKCLEETPEDFFNRPDVEHYAILAAVQYIDNNIDEV